MMNSLFLISIIISAVFFTGLFAGAETGIYQVSKIRLRLGINKKHFPSIILGKALKDTPGLLTSTLVGTNLSIYAVTSIVTYIFLKRTGSEHSAEFLATISTAPLLFVFSELIPKSLFFYCSDALMLRIAPLLFGFYRFLCWCGVIAVFKYISLYLAKLMHAQSPSDDIINATQRHEVAAFFRDIHEESFLSVVQADILNRLVLVSNRPVNRAMTPFKKTQIVSIQSNRQELLDIIKKYEFTRLPVYEAAPENILGYINVYDVVSSKGRIPGLRDYVKPMMKITTNTSVTDAIEMMQAKNEKIALVIRVFGKKHEIPVGIVTVKDLMEEVFGELSPW